MTAAVPLVERLAEVLPDDLQPVGAGLRYVWGEDKGQLTGYGRQIIEALLPVVEQAVAEAREEALWQATNDWQWGQWTVLTEPIKAEAQPQRIIGAAQAVTDWLRERAKAGTKETP